MVAVWLPAVALRAPVSAAWLAAPTPTSTAQAAATTAARRPVMPKFVANRDRADAGLAGSARWRESSERVFFETPSGRVCT